MEYTSARDNMIHNVKKEINHYVIEVMRAIANQDNNEELFMQGCLDGARKSLKELETGNACRTQTLE